MKRGLLLAAMILGAWPLIPAQAAEWETYTNARFGFQLSYPPDLEAGTPPANGAGLVFSAKNGLQIVAQGHFLHDATLDSLWQDALREYGTATTYKVKKTSWFVVSGVRDGEEFYRKTFVRGGNWTSFLITYPHAQAGKFDPIVERVAKEFIPFLEGDYDRIP